MPDLGTNPAEVFANEKLWTIFSVLHEQGETVRRSTLRPHEDKDTRKPGVAQNRIDLDRALDALTQAEIWLQCRGGSASSSTLPHRETMRELLGSDSFLRYLNTYLYFGVRMFLGRYIHPAEVKYPDGGDFKVNREPWWLAAPPPLSRSHAEKAHLRVEMPADTDDIRAALQFLDGAVPDGLQPYSANLSQTLELWIRGLQPELAETPAGNALAQIVRGLTAWSRRQAIFYLRLAPGVHSETHPLQTRPEGGWRCDSPVIARAAMGDLYWIAGLLRTDVTAAAAVTNRAVSWLGLLRFRAALFGSGEEQRDLQATEEILREVFGTCCDLVQNAYEVASAEQLRMASAPTGQRSDTAMVESGAVGWRAVFDRELDEVRSQREYREYGAGHVHHDEPTAARWSRHLYTGETVPDLIGLAFSGGGIRSATFNLGVLQGMQELDLLRQVDYLSTVSGGGFTGSWLMGNVKRSTYWLGRLTPWGESITHLRKFSNYLAPRTGILSMDTWSLGALWLRNTLLIQLAALTWLLVLFCGVYLLRLLFLALAAADAALGSHGWIGLPTGAALLSGAGRLLLPLLAALVVAEILANLQSDPTRRQSPDLSQAKLRTDESKGSAKTGGLLQGSSVMALAVVPAWLGAALLATQQFAMAWRSHCATPLSLPNWHLNSSASCVVTGGEPQFSTVFFSPFTQGWGEYKSWLLLLFTFGGLFLLSRVSLLHSKTHGAGDRVRREWAAAGIAGLCTVLVHVCLSAILLLMELQVWHLHSLDRVSTLAAVWGPAATLGTYSLAILLMIGLAGRASDSGQREWWTRYGACVLGCAVLGCAIPALVFGGPWFLHWLRHTRWIKWGAIGTWVATSVGGLLAGKSSRTAGEGATRAPSLQLLANAGGALFLLGAALGAAELLFVYVRAEVSPVHRLGVLGVEALAGGTVLSVTLIVLLLCALVFSWRFDLNVFGLSELYRNRLVRCYLGATRWQAGARHPTAFTGFDFNDDLDLSTLSGLGFRGPFPIVNCSLNLAGSADLALHTRHSASFTLTPVYCGAAREHVGYRPTEHFAGGLKLGQAIAVSGAAASPNMGYNTAPLVAFLLTLFNVRLGWWFPNPGSAEVNRSGPGSLYYLLLELLGMASERRAYVNVTDGGHFENLGIYELVRRRAQLIIACDAECDESMTFTGLANAIRLCATDFGAHIELDLSSVRRGSDGLSRAHSAVGLIRYSNGSVGRILYLKASLTGDEDVSVAQYASSHRTFPHESTANQFFKEEQFESYRRLGHHALRAALRGVTTREPLIRAAERLIDTTTPAASTTEQFLVHTRALERLWQHFREDHPLRVPRSGFLEELLGLSISPSSSTAPSADETAMCLEMLQLMENTFLDLKLDDYWEHPDHRGWALLFMNWARSPRFRAVWAANHRTFGIRFEHFCASRLGLVKDTPVLRVSPLTRD